MRSSRASRSRQRLDVIRRAALATVAAYVPFTPGRSDASETSPPVYWETGFSPLPYAHAHKVYSGKLPAWQPAGQFNIDSISDMRSALHLLCEESPTKGFSLKTRKAHYIFQTVVGETLNNIQKTIDNVISSARVVAMPNAAEFAKLIERQARFYRKAVQHICSPIVKRLGTNHCVVASSRGARAGLIDGFNAYGHAVGGALPLDIPRKFAGIERKQLPSTEYTIQLGNLGYNNFKAVHRDFVNHLTRSNWCKDLYSKEEEELDIKFSQGLRALLKDVDLVNSVMNQEIVNTNYTAGLQGKGQPIDKFWNGLAELRTSELGKLHSLKQMHDKAKTEGYDKSWLLLLLNPDDSLPLDLPDGSVQQKRNVLGNLSTFQDQFGSLRSLLGMEATSLFARVLLETHLAVLTLGHDLGSGQFQYLVAMGSGRSRKDPYKQLTSNFKFFTDHVMTSFCKGLGEDYARVLFREMSFSPIVDVAGWRECYAAPDAWRARREYGFKLPKKDGAIIFDGDVDLPPLWRQSSKRQRMTMKKLEPKHRLTLMQREENLGEFCE